MSPAVRNRLFIFLTGIILVSFGSIAVILFARGYRPNIQDGSINATGLLVAKSYPDAAQIYVNDRLLNATDTTINLSPGTYDVQIKKEGYITWRKQLEIEAEIVTRAIARLFPSVPTLKPITTSGATNPSASPDSEKAIYSLKDATGYKLFLVDLNESPLGLLNRDSRLLSTSKTLDFTKFAYTWSPDSRQILAQATSSAYLIDINSTQIQNVSLNPTEILAGWKTRENSKNQQLMLTLPEQLQDIIATSAAEIVWAPSETKIMYTATSSASLPPVLRKPLLGSNNQPQQRTLIPGHVYVFDLEEDRNFFVGSKAIPTPSPKPAKNTKNTNSQLTTHNPQLNAGWRWFPDSNHLMRVSGSQVIVKEYDGQNETIVYSGPLEGGFAAPYSSGRQLLILANLSLTPNPSQTPAENGPQLHAVSLK